MDWLRRNTWVVPLAFALAFAAAGYSALRALERHQRAQLASEVQTTLAAATEALDVWVRNNEAIAAVYASDLRIRRALSDLARLARISEDPSTALRASPAQLELREILSDAAIVLGFEGWGAQDVSGLMIANQADDQIGFRPAALADLRRDAIAELRVEHTPPIPYDTPNGVSVLMIVGGPVLDPNDKPVATLGFSLNPSKAFARLLEVARLGTSGETYAFDENGLMVSPSRFEDQLRGIGLLPDDPSVGAAMQIQIRDPGGDMTLGYVPELPAKARPFTKAAAAAIAGDAGFDIDGYHDYRGVPVIGAWAWVPSLRIGIASEIDVDEAYAALHDVQLRFSIVIGLLVLAAIGMGGYSIVLARLQGKVDEARQLGRYRVERKLGQGGMGTVYLARHALLRRPTAIKVLESEAAEEHAAQRFEREVQVSSSLSHPNTIEIYDFGYAPDGAFYYAMEYVGGITLASLCEKDGPQPDARVRFIMSQVAGSLGEAHMMGLVHRDLKPSNIMLCERGGMHDFVKVLDFGLVRAQQQTDDLAITTTQAVTGTPLYMSPEALQDPTSLDARADVYQLGAVAYYLLAGRPPFEGQGLVEVLAKHMKEPAAPPSDLIGRKVSAELEAIVLRCLAKDPDDRYEDASALRIALEGAAIEGVWGRDEARVWWEEWTGIHGFELEGAVSGTGSTPSGYSIDLLSRIRGSRSR